MNLQATLSVSPVRSATVVGSNTSPPIVTVTWRVVSEYRGH
jgi:hypothetical protein